MRAFFGMAAEEHQPSVAEAKLGAEEPEDRVAPNKSANSVADLKLSAADDQVANSTLDGAADADDMAFDIVPDTKAASMSPTRPSPLPLRCAWLWVCYRTGNGHGRASC